MTALPRLIRTTFSWVCVLLRSVLLTKINRKEKDGPVVGPLRGLDTPSVPFPRIKVSSLLEDNK